VVELPESVSSSVLISGSGGLMAFCRHTASVFHSKMA
jgi:hypothetical protein